MLATVDPILAWQQEMEGGNDDRHHHSQQQNSPNTAASSLPTKSHRAAAIRKMATTPEGMNLTTCKGQLYETAARTQSRRQQKIFQRDLEDRALGTMPLSDDHRILDFLPSEPSTAPASLPQNPKQAAEQAQEPDFLSLLISSSAPKRTNNILSGATERSPERAKPKAAPEAAVDEKHMGPSSKQQKRSCSPYTPDLSRGRLSMPSTADQTESHELGPRPFDSAASRAASLTQDDTMANSSSAATPARMPPQRASQRRQAALVAAHSRIIAELEALEKEGVVQAGDISTGLVGFLRRQPLEVALDAMWELRFCHLERVRDVVSYLKGITRRMAEERLYMPDSTGDSWSPNENCEWWQF